MRELLKFLLETLQNRRDAVLCRILDSQGSTPRKCGAAMLVTEDEIRGTIGGGAGEYAAQQEAKNVLRTRISAVRSYSMGSGEAAATGMICGGSITVGFAFFSAGDETARSMLAHAMELTDSERDVWLVTRICDRARWETGTYTPEEGIRFLSQAPEGMQCFSSGECHLSEGEPAFFTQPLGRGGIVYVFGGGHVAQELVPAIARVDFQSVVFEDRVEFADSALFPQAERTILGCYQNLSEKITFRRCDYAVIMTRGHQGDYEVLEQVLRTDVGYVGCIGSRKKHAAVCERLRQAGISEEGIARIHNPIGLPILAQTPAEIAVSVTAELILYRASHR